MALLSSGRAGAVCASDADGDGYGHVPGVGCPALLDCLDIDVDVNPAALEYLDTTPDDNCNGRAAMVVTLGEIAFSPTQWAEVGPVSHTLDRLMLGSVSSSSAATTTRSVAIPLNSSVVVALDVESNVGSGATCQIRLATSADPTPVAPISWASLGIGAPGTQMLSFQGLVAPGRFLKKVQLACYGNRQLGVDWLQIQDSRSVFPPPKELSVDWQDTRHPVGGANTTLARDDGNGTLYMGSDVAGVGNRIPGQGWRVANGTGTDSLMAGGQLGVGDILPMEDATGWVYALTGDAAEIVEGDAGLNSGIMGGLWFSADKGDHWEQLGSSLYEFPPALGGDYGTFEDDVAGYPLESNCYGSHFDHAWSSAGGRTLAADSLSPTSGDVIYIANTDKDAMGVSIYDGDDICAMPNSGAALPADRIGALLRVDAQPNGTPVLVVGYRGRWDGAASVYVCALPAAPDRLDCDPITFSADCQEIGGDLLGADVRDLEIDTWLDESTEYPQETGVLLADGGNRPTDANADGIEDGFCNGDLSGIAELFISDNAGFGLLDVGVVPDVAVAADFADVTVGYSITGISIDPWVDFVFANVPVTPGSVYAFDRMYRIPTDDLLAVPGVPAAAWEAINTGQVGLDPSVEDPYEAVRTTSDLDLSGAWPEAVVNGRAEPFPSRGAPGLGYDTLWIPYLVDAPDAVIAAGSQVWYTQGLTDAWVDDEGDADVIAQAEGDVSFRFWPNIDTDERQTYQSTVVTETRIARDGHIWSANMDQALAHLDATSSSTSSSPNGAEIDCLWHGWHAAANSVSIVDPLDMELVDGQPPDPVVWVTLLDEAVPDNPQRMGVIRTTDNGATWQYAAAGWDSKNANGDWIDSLSVSTDPPTGASYGFRECQDEAPSHVATPFTATTGILSPAHSFSTEASNELAEHMNNETSGLGTSVGNPSEVRALNELAALVLFKPPTDAAAPGKGGFYLTVDGGGTWERLTFDGGAGACSESGTFSAASFEFIHPGTDTRWESDLLEPSLLGELNLDVLVSVNRTGGGASQCSLARVSVQSDVLNGTSTTWSWYTLPFTASSSFDSTPGSCGVYNANLVGAIPAPWANDAMIYGGYDRGLNDPPTEIRQAYGGACLMNLDTGGLTMVVDPRKYAAGISVVAPHPQVTDVWAILPELGAVTYAECSTLPVTNAYPTTITGVDCPYPYPMILQGNATGWQVTTLNTAYPNTKPLTAAWSDLEVMDDSADGYGAWLVVGTGGSGTWRGEMTW